MRCALFKHMFKEEWRLHSTFFGSFLFVTFPIALIFVSFGISLVLPLLSQPFPTALLQKTTAGMFVLFGVMVGSFGLTGREIMNRRFGQASLLAYSSRTLPVSEKSIFTAFFLKDVLYYLLFWILPIVLGYAATAFIINTTVFAIAQLLITATASFLLGLSTTFFLSTIYTQSRLVFMASIGIVTAAAFHISAIANIDILNYLLPMQLLTASSLLKIATPIGAIAIFTFLSIAFLNIDYTHHTQSSANQLTPLSDTLSWTNHPSVVAKDILDLHRSEGGVAKILFSFLFPLILLGILITAFTYFIEQLNALLVFAIFLGLIASSLYNWLTEVDIFATYAFLPINVAQVLKAKTYGFLLLNLTSLALFGIAAATMATSLATVMPALFTYVSVTLYSFAVTVYLTGLSPNILLYNTRIFLTYGGLIGTTLVVLLLLAALRPTALYATPLLLMPAWFLIQQAYGKWNHQEQRHF